MSNNKKVIIFTMPSCAPCDKLEKDMKHKDRVEFQDVEKSDEARNLAFKHGIRTAPSALLKSKEGYKKCEIYFDHKRASAVAKCEGEEIEL